MSAKRIIALVGRRDEPTDGVADYCDFLGGSLPAYGYELETVRVPWPELGWRAALADLRERAKQWQACWVLLQYTTLAWSRRGWPIRTPQVLAALDECGVRRGVIFHDFGPFVAGGMIGAARKHLHLWVLKQLYEQSERAIFTVPVDKVSWLPARHDKAVHIPVGANCPEPEGDETISRDGVMTVAVYCVTTDHRLTQEVRDISTAVKSARAVAGPLRVVVFGRGSREAESALRQDFAGSDIAVEVLGLVPPLEVSQILARADVLLFVRDYISSRRGSAIAGIACGLPVVGFSGPDTGWPITEAGVLLVSEGHRDALASALTRVLADSNCRSELRARSRNAQQNYFSWPAISAALARALSENTDESGRHAQHETPLVTGTKCDPTYQGVEAKK